MHFKKIMQFAVANLFAKLNTVMIWETNLFFINKTFLKRYERILHFKNFCIF